MSDFKTYTLLNIPEKDWRSMKTRASSEGLYIKDLFLKFIKSYGKGGQKP